MKLKKHVSFVIEDKKKFKGRNYDVCEIFDINDFIKQVTDAAIVMNNEKLLEDIKYITNDSKIYNHKKCRKDYTRGIDFENDERDWHLKRKHHSSSYDIVCKFVEEYIVSKFNRYYFLNFLFEMYV